jgi:hypothetical protein
MEASGQHDGQAAARTGFPAGAAVGVFMTTVELTGAPETCACDARNEAGS